jgi:energy-coupling factor transporter ATP-binding protein EcfA2
VISGGQRKRVNIGLELIREPSELFVDEPTSGLSSVDSEMVMNLLKEQVYKGKLVIVNIHQPSSNLYKMFDRMIFLDKGGYQIYYGNPTEAVVYFKTRSNHANAREDQCKCCGNVDPDQVLQIIEAKIVNEHGKLSRTRKVSPKEWFNYFKSNGGKPVTEESPSKEELPGNYYNIPGILTQLKIFFLRDIYSKLTNKQYVLLSLLEAPFLAVILGYFTKYFSGTTDNPASYVFRNNENLPAFLFMSVIVFLFLGLIISSEEIIKDRKILERESFLNLSRFSYLNSKILILFAISAIQTISYVLIGNLIFEIRGMTFSYWLILFTTSCAANVMGLNISSGLNSVITIYILVPFLIIPQLLLSGVIVKFDKLHKSMTKNEFVPVIADLTVSRWAYEALVIDQFKNNRYHRQFFEIDKEISNFQYLDGYLVPALETRLDEAIRYMGQGSEAERVAENLELVRNHLDQLSSEINAVQSSHLSWRDAATLDEQMAGATKTYLADLRTYLQKEKRERSMERNMREQQLITELGGIQQFTEFRDSYENSKLNDILLNRLTTENFVEQNGLLVRKFRPVYKTPNSRFGRAHLYASEKWIGNLSIDTMWFNILVIWLSTLLLYLTLYYDLIRKVLTYFENLKLRRQG